MSREINGAQWHAINMRGISQHDIARQFAVTRDIVRNTLFWYRHKYNLKGPEQKYAHLKAKPLKTPQNKAVDNSLKKITNPGPETFLEVLSGNYCKYIGGDLKGIHKFCGNQKMKRSQYCEEHHDLCYRRKPKE